MNMIYLVVFFLLMINNFIYLEAEVVEFKFTRGVQLTNENIFTFTNVPTMFQCMERCLGNVRCQSFNFKKTSKVCVLNKSGLGHLEENYVKRGDSDIIYGERRDIPKVFECGNEPCEDSDSICIKGCNSSRLCVPGYHCRDQWDSCEGFCKEADMTAGYIRNSCRKTCKYCDNIQNKNNVKDYY